MAPQSIDRVLSLDIPIVNRVFVMESGYVLNLSNTTFAEFFQEEFGISIEAPRW